MIYELRVRRVRGDALDRGVGVFYDLQAKGLDTEFYDRVECLRERCDELERNGVGFALGRRTAEVLEGRTT